MSESFKQFGLRAISGEDRSLRGKLARAAASVIEPFYSTAMVLRNACYDRGIFATHDLGRPAISIGNITTGGTGKTPVVQWLAGELRSRGRHPAILLRGYGAGKTGISDEGLLLDRALNHADQPKIPVQACPSRVDGAARVLKEHPDVDLFILDDAFQHRRAKRDFNLVLISATNPFGFGHVLPRGLLREPLRGLRRADAFLVTRRGLAEREQVWEIDRYLNHNHPEIPVCHCDHEHAGLWLPMTNQTVPMATIAGERVFLTAGIGDPISFSRQIESTGCTIVGSKWFDDHHAFTKGDVDAVMVAAQNSGAVRVITTAKDWMKLKDVAPATGNALMVAVAKLSISFRNLEADQLLSRIGSRLH